MCVKITYKLIKEEDYMNKEIDKLNLNKLSSEVKQSKHDTGKKIHLPSKQIN